jgi:signal transduction histidine kinase
MRRCWAKSNLISDFKDCALNEARGSSTFNKNMTPRKRSRSSWLLYAFFTGGIVLPGSYLTFLGYRSFMSEQALLRLHQEDDFGTVARQTPAAVSEALQPWLSALSSAVKRWPAVAGPELTREALSLREVHDIPVLGVWVMEESGTLAAPFTAPADTRPFSWGEVAPDVQHFERLQRVVGDPNTAAAGFGTLSGEVKDARQRASLQLLAAGALQAAGRLEESAVRLRSVFREAGGTLEAGDVPAGLSAAQMLIRQQIDSRHPDDALDTEAEALEALLSGRWPIQAEQRADLAKAWLADLEGAGRHGHVQAGRLRRLYGRRKNFEAREDSWKKLWPILRGRLRERGWTEKGGVFRLAAGSLRLADPSQTGTALLVVPWPSDRKARGFAVAEIPGAALIDLLKEKASYLAQPLGTEVLLGIGSEALDAVDPPLAFSVTQGAGAAEFEASRRRLRLFGAITVFSGIVLLTGIALMFRAARREREVAELKEDFVANVSHELRTPLTSISYIGELLNTGRFRNEAEQKEFFGMLTDETSRLRELVEEILDFSKGMNESGGYRRERCDLVQLCRQALARYEGKARAKGFTIESDIIARPLWLSGDPNAIVRAMMNLLDNAVKYSPPGSVIRITVRGASSGMAEVRVQDEGVGIAAEEQPRIFERFYRVRQGDAADATVGVGLGLAMVKHIMEGHAGHVVVESRPGEGSVFTLEFPLIKEEDL